MFRVTRGVVVAALLSVTLSAAARAQWRGLREVSPSNGPVAGIDLLFGVPQGRFHQFVQSVGGFGGFLTVPLDRHGVLGLRVDGSMVFHGGDCYLGCNLETSSYIGSLRLGPQLTVGHGRIRAYGLATAGFSYFATDVSDHYDCGCFDPWYSDGGSSTLLDDFTGSWEAGGGLQLFLGRRQRVAVDLSVRYENNGRATYLNNASVTSNGDGTFTIAPLRTSANLILYHVGVSFALP
ncbi:MAG TPA: hypothetical protein VMC86_07190 [Gemmatimonadales bacterium]|nr:hypothetical protein [Gemmatimonadales bacterium]